MTQIPVFNRERALAPTRAKALARAKKAIGALNVAADALPSADGRWLPVAVLAPAQAYLARELMYLGVYATTDAAAIAHFKANPPK